MKDYRENFEKQHKSYQKMHFSISIFQGQQRHSIIKEPVVEISPIPITFFSEKNLEKFCQKLQSDLLNFDFSNFSKEMSETNVSQM